MATIDATAGGPQANCYLTLARADAYFADGLEDLRWDAFTSDEKTRALIAATTQLEGMRLWGGPDTASQALHFPRAEDDCPAEYYEPFTSDLDVAVSLDRPLIVEGTLAITSAADDEGTTYTEDTDYTVDYDAGTITVLSTGTMADATTYYASYAYTGPPIAIERAIAEQALWLLEQRANPELLDRRALQAQGVRSIGMDGISESYVAAGDQGAWAPRAWTLIMGYVKAVGRIGR